MLKYMGFDKNDTIFYISNSKMPYRNPDTSYHWNSTVPGNTMATLWTKFKPLSELPQYLNPTSGYLFNTNHSPFLATAENENLNRAKFDVNDGYELTHNNRSRRAKDLIDQLDKISYADLLVKFWEEHDPTSGMRQGNDVGTQYRSAIYPTSAEQLLLAQQSKLDYQASLQNSGLGEITSEIELTAEFYFAEPEHQQYLDRVPNGYCALKGTGVRCL